MLVTFKTYLQIFEETLGQATAKEFKQVNIQIFEQSKATCDTMGGTMIVFNPFSNTPTNR